MSTDNIIKLISIGELALNHWIAQVDAKHAKREYHEAILKHEGRHGRDYDRIDPDNQSCYGVIRATAGKYAAYLDARRIARNIARRLDTACRNTPKF